MIKTSLVLLVFNGENYINRALDSVYQQTYKLDEIVIVNDASNDKTGEIIDRWSERLPIIDIKNIKNIGLFPSLIQGIDKSSGDLIFRIDHDDVWMNNHVEEIINLYKKDKDAKIYSTRAIYLDENSKFLKRSEIISNTNVKQKIIWDNPFVQSATAFFKKDFNEVCQPTQMYSSEDYNLWIRLLKLGRINFSPKTTIYYFVYQNSLSRQNIKRNYEERFICQFRALKTFFLDIPIRVILISLVLIL